VQIATWSAASASRPPGPGAGASRGRWEGRSCRWWVAGVPFGLPRIEEAMGDALARARGRAMRDLTVTSTHTFYGVAGQHCYVVKGEVVT
jgi:hypothetical protein